MNLEQLFKTVLANYGRLKDKKKTRMFLLYHVDLLQRKRKKLKLGKVVFELKRYVVAEITIFEELEMIFIRQDNTIENELKIENRLKALDWKWDFSNVGAFIIVASFALLLCYAFIYCWYCENLPEFAFRRQEIDELIKFNFYNIYVGPTVTHFKLFKVSNYWIYEALSDFSIKYNIL